MVHGYSSTKGLGTETKDDTCTSFSTKHEKLILCAQSSCGTVNVDLCVVDSTAFVNSAFLFAAVLGIVSFGVKNSKN